MPRSSTSEGGCQLRAEAALSAEDVVQLDCNLDGTTMQLTGQVVYVGFADDTDVAGISGDEHVV